MNAINTYHPSYSLISFPVQSRMKDSENSSSGSSSLRMNLYSEAPRKTPAIYIPNLARASTTDPPMKNLYCYLRTKVKKQSTLTSIITPEHEELFKEISHLDNNWDERGAIRISDEVIKRTKHAYRKMGIVPTNVWPTNRGSIELEYRNETKIISLEITINMYLLKEFNRITNELRYIQTESSMDNIRIIRSV